MHMAAGEAAIFLLTVMKVNVDRGIITALGVFLVLVAALYGAYVLLRNTDLAMPALYRPLSGDRLLMSMEGFRFVEMENGKVLWRVAAGSADLYENKETQLKNVEITFVAPDNREARLIGEAATLDTVTGNASISRGVREVRIVTSEGYVLTTNSLFWRADQRIVRTADPFKLLGSELYLEGQGLSGNADMGTIEVDKHVKAVLQE
jgi:LPS export ABC transporter protein LptC